MLVARYGSIAGARAVLAELYGPSRSDRALDAALAEILQVCHVVPGDVVALTTAWDGGPACPFGRGLLPLPSVHTDLPMLERCVQLGADARLVLLAVANEAGQRVAQRYSGECASTARPPTAATRYSVVAGLPRR